MICIARARRIDTMITIGCGDLVKNRLLPSQCQLAEEGILLRSGYLDVSAACPIRPDGRLRAASAYFRVRPGSRLPLADLEAGRWLGPYVLAYVATPTVFHMPYVRQLLGTACRIAVEKPLTDHPAEAEDLLNFPTGTVFPVGHQLFKRAMLDFLETYRPGDVLGASAIEFDLMETKGIGNREIDDAVWDLGWHGFEVMRAAYRAAGAEVRMCPTDVRIATYKSPVGGPAPGRFTAARIEGFLEAMGRVVPFVIRVGKGLGQTSKRLMFLDARGRTRQEVPMGESGWEAHYRLLLELMTAPQPDLRLGLAETLDLARACQAAAALATDEGSYAFGTTPAFLLTPSSLALSVCPRGCCLTTSHVIGRDEM
jgi:hypothetical protein